MTMLIDTIRPQYTKQNLYAQLPKLRLLSKFRLLFLHLQVFLDEVGIDYGPDLRLEDHDDDEEHQGDEEELVEDDQKKLDDLDEEDHELKCYLALGFPQHDHRICEVANHRGGHEEQEPLPKG